MCSAPIESQAMTALRWVEQLEATRRYYYRFKRAREGEPWKGKARAEVLDDVYTFFLHCYHLKDWAKQHAAWLGGSETEIENLVTQNPSLALCADLCNLLKHFELTKPPRSGARPRITEAFVDLVFVRTGVGEAQLLQRARITIEHGGETIDAFDLATEAMVAWDAFLQPRLATLMSKLDQ